MKTNHILRIAAIKDIQEALNLTQREASEITGLSIEHKVTKEMWDKLTQQVNKGIVEYIEKSIIPIEYYDWTPGQKMLFKIMKRLYNQRKAA